MSIFKGKEIRLLKARVNNNEERLTRLECKHPEQCFMDYRRNKNDPWCGGHIECTNCGKLIKQLTNEIEFLIDDFGWNGNPCSNKCICNRKLN